MNDMNSRIPYMTDEFLKQFKSEFLTIFAPLYKLGDTEALKAYFTDPNHVVLSEYTYTYRPLEVESKEYNPDIVRRNIRRIWESLGFLTPAQAELEKIWVALAHTDYLDYQMGVYESQIAGTNNVDKADRSLQSRTIFVNGNKRSLAIHNISILWWLAYYFEDTQHEANPFHLLDFFFSTSYRGNAVALLSSNIISNQNIALGILEAVKYLVENERLIPNRYAYSEPSRILNEIGGVRILDMLTRKEVRDIIINQLPKQGKKLQFRDATEDAIEQVLDKNVVGLVNFNIDTTDKWGKLISLGPIHTIPSVNTEDDEEETWTYI